MSIIKLCTHRQIQSLVIVWRVYLVKLRVDSTLSRSSCVWFLASRALSELQSPFNLHKFELQEHEMDYHGEFMNLRNSDMQIAHHPRDMQPLQFEALSDERILNYIWYWSQSVSDIEQELGMTVIKNCSNPMCLIGVMLWLNISSLDLRIVWLGLRKKQSNDQIGDRTRKLLQRELCNKTFQSPHCHSQVTKIWADTSW